MTLVAGNITRRPPSSRGNLFRGAEAWQLRCSLHNPQQIHVPHNCVSRCGRHTDGKQLAAEEAGERSPPRHPPPPRADRQETHPPVEQPENDRPRVLGIVSQNGPPLPRRSPRRFAPLTMAWTERSRWGGTADHDAWNTQHSVRGKSQVDCLPAPSERTGVDVDEPTGTASCCWSVADGGKK